MLQFQQKNRLIYQFQLILLSYNLLEQVLYLQIMQSSDIAKRILDLKKVSVELKESTQNISGGTVDLVRGLLQLGKKPSSSSIDSARFSFKPQEQKNSHQNQISFVEAILKKHTSNQSKAVKQNIEPFAKKNSQNDEQKNANSEKVFKMLANGLTNDKSITKAESDLSPEDQISRIKDQNLQLEQKLKALQQEMQKLEQIERMESEEQWKDGLPYFVLNHPNLKAFCTKLSIVEKDYAKIDYISYSVSLSLEHLILNPTKIKAHDYTKNNIGTAGSKKSIVLSLKNLKQVQYPSRQFHHGALESFSPNFTKNLNHQKQFVIIYHFLVKQDNNRPKKIYSEESVLLQTLFMKFDSEQQRNQWDLGIYVNYKILQNLRNDNTDAFSQISKDQKANKKQFKEIAKKFKVNNEGNINQLQKKSESIDSETMTPFLKQVNSSPLKKKIIIPNNKQQIRQRSSSQENISPEFNQNVQISQKMKDFDESLKKIEEEQRLKKQQEQLAHKKQEEDEKNRKIKEEKEKEKRLEEEKNKKLQEQQRKRREQEQKRQEDQRAKIILKMKKDVDLKDSFRKLKQGYILTKYATGALKPHEKRVFMSSDGNNLCWRDIDSTDYKSVKLEQIYKVGQGQIGEGIKKHRSDIDDAMKFCTLSLSSKSRAMLELGAKTPIIMQNFCNDVRNVCVLTDQKQQNLF